MEKDNDQKPSAIPDQDEQEIRINDQLVDAIAARITGSNPPPLLSDEQTEELEATRAAEAELTLGQDLAERLYGGRTESDTIARAIARFDAKESAPQPAEFIRSTDAAYKKRGFI